MVTKLISKILMLGIFVIKRCKNWRNYTPQPLPSCSMVKAKKKADVKELLAAIGASEDVMDFYTNALGRDVNVDAVSSDADD